MLNTLPDIPCLMVCFLCSTNVNAHSMFGTSDYIDWVTEGIYFDISQLRGTICN